ncbi:MAG: hypothetical protein ACM3OO_11260 [Planctomycetaceae bacterium]
MTEDGDPTVPEQPHPRYLFGDPPGARDYVVDERNPQTGHWAELGRYVTEDDAAAAMAALIADGRPQGDLRVARRPKYDTD